MEDWHWGQSLTCRSVYQRASPVSVPSIQAETNVRMCGHGFRSVGFGFFIVLSLSRKEAPAAGELLQQVVELHPPPRQA